MIEIDKKNQEVKNERQNIKKKINELTLKYKYNKNLQKQQESNQKFMNLQKLH